MPELYPGDKVAIDYIMLNVHVGTPDDKVEADIRARIARSAMAAPRQYEDAVVAYALEVHRDNQRLYRDVTGSI